MTKIIILCLLVVSNLAAYAYDFDTKMHAQVIKIDKTIDGYDSTMTLKIMEHLSEKIKDPYPIGTQINLKVFNQSRADYFNNPKMFASIVSIILPDGSTAPKNFKSFELKGISGIKSFWIPFYRLSKLFGDKSKRIFKQDSWVILKPAKADKVIGILDN